MKVVYIASPYTKGDAAENVRRQIDAFDGLAYHGFAPIAPLLGHFVQIVNPLDYDTWTRIDMALVLKSDAVLRLEGESYGADAEVLEASRSGIPVFYDIPALVRHFTGKALN